MNVEPVVIANRKMLTISNLSHTFSYTSSFRGRYAKLFNHSIKFRCFRTIIPKKYESSQNVTPSSTQLGQLEGIPMEFGESDLTSRENLIKTHYTSRLAEVTSQRQVAGSKAVNFSAEVSHYSLCLASVGQLVKSSFKSHINRQGVFYMP